MAIYFMYGGNLVRPRTTSFWDLASRIWPGLRSKYILKHNPPQAASGVEISHKTLRISPNRAGKCVEPAKGIRGSSGPMSGDPESMREF